MAEQTLLNLRILLPFGVFAAQVGVSRIVADTGVGSLGVLPNRLDFVAGIFPGILMYEVGQQGEVYLAVDQGILIKTGLDVIVSVRNAIASADLDHLYDAVEREFKILDQSERNLRSVMSKIESSFISRIAGFSHV